MHELNHKTAIEQLLDESFLKMIVLRQEKNSGNKFNYASTLHPITMAVEIRFVQLEVSLSYWDNIQH